MNGFEAQVRAVNEAMMVFKAFVDHCLPKWHPSPMVDPTFRAPKTVTSVDKSQAAVRAARAKMLAAGEDARMALAAFAAATEDLQLKMYRHTVLCDVKAKTDAAHNDTRQLQMFRAQAAAQEQLLIEEQRARQGGVTLPSLLGMNRFVTPPPQHASRALCSDTTSTAMTEDSDEDSDEDLEDKFERLES